MHIIPVIDVRNGVAVRAVAGDRASYRPLVSPLVSAQSAAERGQTHGSDPVLSGQTGATALDVACGYRRVFPFQTIYVADLDGIEGRGANTGLAPTLAAALPEVEFWIDAGRVTDDEASGVTVIGSEMLTGAHAAKPIAPSAVLSLDFRGDTFLGPPALLDSTDLWPSRVIVMTLARVGTDRGPDLQRVAETVRRAPRTHVYAAGGIRDMDDLKRVRDAGAHGALIASALHAQKIKADDLREIIGP